jgi:hypothetical protein
MPVSETVTNMVKALENLYCRKHDAQDFSMALSRFARRTHKDRVLALRLKTERLVRRLMAGQTPQERGSVRPLDRDNR